MGIQLVYAAFCDCCEDDLEECFGQTWDTRGDAEYAAKNAGWVYRDGELLCEDCASIEDDDDESSEDESDDADEVGEETAEPQS